MAAGHVNNFTPADLVSVRWDDSSLPNYDDLFSHSRRNPLYKVNVLNLEDADKRISISTSIAAEKRVGIAVRGPRYNDKFVDLATLLVIATPLECFVFRTHNSTILPPFLVHLFAKKNKIEKVSIGRHQTGLELQRVCQKTFDQAPTPVEEIFLFAREKGLDAPEKRAVDAEDVDVFEW